MSKKFDDYLGNLARHLRDLPANVREDEVREMHSHLEQLRDDFASQGQNPEAAAQAALEQFGDARAVGIKVRDVWEGQILSWKRVLAAFLAGLLFWTAATGFTALSFVAFQTWPQSALFALETHWIFIVVVVLIPILTAAIHSFYLGRRAWMMSAAIYIPLWRLEETSNQLPSLTLGAYQMSFWAWSLILGVPGALTSAWLLRHQRSALWSLAGANAPISILNGGLAYRLGNTKRNWTFLALVIGITLSIVLWGNVQARLDSARHPRSARDAVLNQLLLNRDASKMAPPDPIEVEEISPTPAELAAGTRRVRFRTVCHMTQSYEKRRVEFLQAQLATVSGRKQFGEKNLRSSLRRVRANGFPFSGTVRVKKTPSGWQVEGDNNYWSRLWGWAEDVYFEE